jgi:hypothetical protein
MDVCRARVELMVTAQRNYSTHALLLRVITLVPLQKCRSLSCKRHIASPSKIWLPGCAGSAKHIWPCKWPQFTLGAHHLASV